MNDTDIIKKADLIFEIGARGFIFENAIFIKNSKPKVFARKNK